MSAPPDPADLLPAIIAAAQRAGETAMGYFRHGARTSAGVQSKAGGSPVTEADHAVDRYLIEQLRGLDADAGWLSEETADTPERLGRSRVFIVDPIDATRAFMTGDPRWGVSIAWVVDGLPRLGVLAMPALGQTFTALEGKGAWIGDRRVRVSSAESLRNARVAGTVPMLERFARTGAPVQPQPKVPSLAYRLAMVANGDLEAGFASTNAHDWDIAAADLIVHEAGGFLIDAQGRRPAYNRPTPTHGILAAAPERFRSEIEARLKLMS